MGRKDYFYQCIELHGQKIIPEPSYEIFESTGVRVSAAPR